MAKNSASKWSTRDLMVTIVIGLAFGVLMIPVTNLYAFIRASGPLAQTAVGSLYFVPVAFAAYVMRKPGVVILVSVISGVVVLVTPYGFYALLISIVTGLIGELVFWLLTRYRQVGLGRLLFFGALCGLLEFVVLLRALGSSQFELAVLAMALGLSAITFAGCALIAKILADAVARTGVLANTALGRANIEEV